MATSITDFQSTASAAMQSVDQYQQTRLQSRLKNLENGEQSELLDACKSFEAYFIEQVMKEVSKTTDLFGLGDSSSYAGQMTDYFKDSVIQTLAGKVGDQTGNALAMQLYEAMKRNYGIDEGDASE